MAGNSVYLDTIDLALRYTSTSQVVGVAPKHLRQSGEVESLNLTTGKVQWDDKVAQLASRRRNGREQPARHDALHRSSSLAINRSTGAVVLRLRLPTTTNSALAIAGNTIIVPAGGLKSGHATRRLTPDRGVPAPVGSAVSYIRSMDCLSPNDSPTRGSTPGTVTISTRSWSHFHDDVVFSSPLAQRIVEGSHGYVRGKDELRAYWTEGLARNMELHFTLEGIYAGVDTLVINYRNHDCVSSSTRSSSLTVRWSSKVTVPTRSDRVIRSSELAP